MQACDPQQPVFQPADTMASQPPFSVKQQMLYVARARCVPNVRLWRDNIRVVQGGKHEKSRIRRVTGYIGLADIQ